MRGAHGARRRAPRRFDPPRFKELVLELPVAGDALLPRLAERGFLAGPCLGRWWPELGNCVLVAVTEKRSEADVTALAEAIEKEVAEL